MFLYCGKVTSVTDKSGGEQETVGFSLPTFSSGIHQYICILFLLFIFDKSSPEGALRRVVCV